MVFSALLCGVVACVGTDGTASDLTGTDYAPRPLASIVLAPDSVDIAIGDEIQLSPAFLDREGKELKSSSVAPQWESSDTSIVRVSPRGVVTARSVGTAHVFVRSGKFYSRGKVRVRRYRNNNNNNNNRPPVTEEPQTPAPKPENPPPAEEKPAPEDPKPTLPPPPVVEPDPTPTPTPPPPPPSVPQTPSGEPVPSASDKILLDTRASIQRAKSAAEAWATSLQHSMSGRTWHFTENMDGMGTRALRLDWPKYSGKCQDDGALLITYFQAPYPTHVMFSWKHRLGRTPTGGGIGEVNSFKVANAACGNAARKMFLLLRDVPDRGAKGRLEYIWPGPAPVRPTVTSDSYNLSFGMLPGQNFNPEQNVGRTITHTFEIKAASSATARDGIIRMWINGVKVIDVTNAQIGPEAIHRFQFPATFNSPSQDQSEYFWDIVAWVPKK